MTDEDRKALAGEYVLGLLDDAARADVELRMADDPALRKMVLALAHQMNKLDAALPADPVPSDLWNRIKGRIGGVTQDGAPAPAPRVSAVPASESARRTSLRSRAWPAMQIAASLLIAFAAGYGIRWLTTDTPDPVVLVVLQTPENVPGAIFEAFADNSVRILPLEDFAVPEGKILQVWTLYDENVGPVSLGTLPRAEAAHLTGQPLPRPVAEQLYEITLEPAPGSPTGRPTGPILVKGFAQPLPG